MVFEDTILIEAPPERVFAFFRDMEAHYLDWHPDHLAFRWIEGDSLQEGNVCYFEEQIAGEVLKKKVRFRNVVPNRYIAFVPTGWLLRLFLPRMSFEMEERGGGATLFRAQIHLRVGPLGARWHREQFDAVRRHMKEEGENLKAWAEEQKSPSDQALLDGA